MIVHLQYHQVDKERYDQCISASNNSRVYAYSWYLDLVCNNWDALVMGDYEAVMPLPWKTKFGLPLVYTPNWAQQLGVFSKVGSSRKLLLDFLGAIPKRFLKIDYRMNADNQLDHKSMSVRENYLLVLDQSYEQMFKRFKGSRKKAVRLNFEDYLLNKNSSIDEFQQFVQSVEKPFELQKAALESLNALINSGREELRLWSVTKDGQILAALLWIKDSRRLTCLLPLSSELGKKLQLPTFLISELIKCFENSGLVIDFEGSMIKGVAQFYRSFGAEREHYYVYRKRLFGHV